MNSENKNRILTLLNKDFKELKVAGDLPRFVSCLFIDKQQKPSEEDGEDEEGEEEECKQGRKCVRLYDGRTEGGNVCKVLTLLAQELDPQVNRTAFETKFYGLFPSGKIELAHQFEQLLSQEFQGGNNNKVIKLLKTFTQALVSPVIIELKTLLGQQNFTKDVKESWMTTVTLEQSQINVGILKREQHLQNLFQYQWRLTLTFDRDISCKQVDVVIQDLLFHESLNAPQGVERKEEIKQKLARYCSEGVLKASDCKPWFASLHTITGLYIH